MNRSKPYSTSSPLRYPGGKYRARKILFSKLPEHLQTPVSVQAGAQREPLGGIQEQEENRAESLTRGSAGLSGGEVGNSSASPLIVSPFIGGGSFELYLTQHGHKVSGFDGFDLLANFWNVLLTAPEQLAEALQSYYGTVDSIVFKSLQQKLKTASSSIKFLKTLQNGQDENELYGSTNVDDSPSTKNIQKAAEFLIVNRCSFSGATLAGGFSQSSATDRFTQSVIDKVRSFSNPLLTVQYSLVEDTFRRLPEGTDLLFLDPPYWLEQSKNKLYGIGGNLHQSFDHERFYNLVKDSGKPFLLTYNDSSDVRDLWKDYLITEAEWSYGMNKSKRSSEIVIRNYDG